MKLSKDILSKLDHNKVQFPDNSNFSLPEKVLQFGTGVLLRGLTDYFIDKANKQNIFNGRIVVVKSTGTAGADAFATQNGLYTISVRGLENGVKKEEDIISGSISRVLSAKDEWQSILDVATSADLQVVISNTTEVGIQYVEESIHQTPPASFPGKLLACLYTRFKALGATHGAGWVIIPTELIVGNGDKLKEIILKLAKHNALGDDFINWVHQENTFCNSLVDRIVPGLPAPEVKAEIEANIGYADDLLLMTEVYRLWAIEGNENVKSILSFHRVDEGVIITPDIEIYRELKLRLLNGTHTLSCGIGFLAGFETVKEAMANSDFNRFVHNVMLKDIAPAIPAEIDMKTAEKFGLQVIDRFANPYINHKWISITVQFTSKVKMRILPVLEVFYKKYNTVPEYISSGLAAYLLFSRPQNIENGQYQGIWNGKEYPIQDDAAAVLHELWNNNKDQNFVHAVLSNVQLWGQDLSLYTGLEKAVYGYYKNLETANPLNHLPG